MGKLWSRSEISCKWAPFHLYGGNVSEANALEFIRRTDPALVSPKWLCNDHAFEEQLQQLVGYPSDDSDWSAQRRFEEAFSAAFGHIQLQHLGSHWVASSFIHGPHGPISPNGCVHDVRNFGKYPSIAEIESDLGALDAFHWLKFRLYVWDSPAEEADGEPDFGWEFRNGEWERTEEPPAEVRREPDFEKAISAIVWMSTRARETTWSANQIRELWGEQIARAAEAGRAALQERS